MKKIIIITGQTATGKSGVALSLAKQHGGHIIGADSRHIYQHLDIITGKDIPHLPHSPQTPSFFVHHSDITIEGNKLQVGHYAIGDAHLWGMDIVSPKQSFSAYYYIKYVKYILENAIPAGVVPIIVGGSYLYIRHLLDGIDLTATPDQDRRKLLESLTVTDLQDKLSILHPDIFSQLNQSDKHNPHRLIRKIEIALDREESGQREKGLLEEGFTLQQFDGYMCQDRDLLRSTISKRVDQRLENGAEREVRQLFQRGYTMNDPGLQTIGYTQLAAYISGTATLEEARQQWIQAEVKYAKRQLTFMKQDSRIAWHTI